MPELPEVETVARAVSSAVTGLKIEKVVINRDKIRLPIPTDFKKKTENTVILKVERTAKYIFMTLANGETIVVHLGMSGRITITDRYTAKKHDHIIFYFKDGPVMIYNDARRFGFVSFLKNIDLSNLGIDALDKNFTASYLKKKIYNKSSSIKVLMLDQSIVGGIGNIYIIESLFKSHINPLKPANLLSDEELKCLVTNIKTILKDAIANGGTTLRDYRKVSGELGSFQNKLAIYGKEGKDCHVCGTKILRVAQGGRSTFYCPHCQPL